MGLLMRIRWGRLLLTAAAAGALWQVTSDRDPVLLTDDHALLSNRPWIDRLPQSERDIISHLVFLDKDDLRTGAVGRSSAWRQSAERFQWAPGTEHLTLTFPQSEKTGKLRIAIRTCTAPEPLNLCLKIGTGRAAPTLYSSTEWTLESAEPQGILSVLPIDPEADSVDTELRLLALME